VRRRARRSLSHPHEHRRRITKETPLVSLQRLQLAAVCLVITLLVFTQSSGLEAADTKLDLVVDPWHFLVQSVSAWDPTAAAGGLGNQAYGYLFPIGPFFLLGHLMHLPPWVTQRAWESALLIAAFLGTFRLARLLGVVGWWPRVATGLSYALAPRMLMEIGAISSELLPVAVLPWVLIPLVRGSRDGSPRRAAAMSGIALLFASGTNAAATLAILPIPVLWLLTRQRGKRRAALMRWWALAVGLSCLWWTVPLIVLGKYSPPFLDWIESAAVTTSQTSLANTLRGVEHWEAYLGSGTWPAGFIFVTERTVILATALVAGAGLIGVALRRAPHRLFLGLCLATGLVLATFGHVSSIGPLLATTEQNALDGPLNAFRNIHKFDPLVRLPIALGVGFLLAAGFARWNRRGPAQPDRGKYAVDPRVTGTVAAFCIAIAAVAPAVTGALIPGVRGVNEPSWWTQTASWLGQQGDGRALVVPGAAQPVYLWGRPGDDALQPVATSEWTVRDAIPLATAGYIRLLDAIEARLAAGRQDPTLAAVLARSGIRYVVVRNDLAISESHATPLQFIYATLNNSAGFRQVANFGPNLISAPDPNRLIDSGATTTHAAITVYENTAWTGDLALLPASQAVAANGSADNLPGLTAAGVTPDQPVVFAPSVLPAGATSTPVMTALTDGVRRREFTFGGISHYSNTMTASQPYEAKRAAHDYLPSPAPQLSTISYQGISDVTASSSGSDAGAVVNISPVNSPWSAVDGNPFTAWRVGDFNGAVGQWLQVDLPSAIDASRATISFVGVSQGFPDRIRVDTSGGHIDEGVTPDGLPQPIRLPSGNTQFVRVTILGIADGSPGLAAGIAVLSIPSVTPSRTLNVPGAGQPDMIAFSVEDGYRSECLTVHGTPACDPSWAAAGEEDKSLDRTFVLSKGATYVPQAHVTLQPGPDLDQLLDRGDPFSALASSVDSSDPRQRAEAAVDGDVSTGWMAGASDLQPTLVVGTDRARRVTGIRLTPLADAAARAPVEVQVTAGSESVDRVVPLDGIVRLRHAVKTRTVVVHVVRATVRTTTSSTTGLPQFLPVGIAELALLGPHEPVAHTPTHFTLACSDGLTMAVDGQRIPLRITSPWQPALAGDALAATPCTKPGSPSWLALGAGPHRVTLTSTDVTNPTSVVLSRVDQPIRPTPVALPATKLSWSSTNRSVRVQTSVPALLVVHENANQGWQATYRGATLAAVTVDGWQQAWVVPARANGVVHLRFTPQTAFTAGLIGGAAGAALLVVLILPLPLPSWLRRRRRVPSALRTASPGSLARWFAILATLTLLGSVSGLIVGVGLAVVEVAAPGVLRGRAGFWALAVTLVATATVETVSTAASHHPLAGSAGVQILCLVAIGLVILRCLLTRDRSPGARELTK
jgi:arabinofuranan 3-O-arabinosyltransferase